MLEGFYKVRYQVDDAVGRSVMYVHDGKMLGGNSAFAHFGTYREADGVVTAEITSQRAHQDPNYPSLLGADIATIEATGRAQGNVYHFRGGSAQMPGAVFQSMMTPIDHDTKPPDGAVGEGGIVNGLYSIHIRMLDGVEGRLTGMLLLSDGRILGGDAFFYYQGTYTSALGRWKGQILNQEHTPAKIEHPIFGGHEVGIGFSGSCDQEAAELEAMALVGKRSIRLSASLKLMRRA
ncbi:MAG: hypothetical protein HXX15_10705 [Rhodopseudomonas sp.]|uniref:GrlR family regulatory protein n=1 Tax=Rhodopseudomonas sp. TaxID=1078 RepID=UPI0017F2C2F1|nr:GrlR family regulatory protein [Rhodopseudomonas sp.]NVN86545.1 hypothetical protein [Rhodopseudomonas sp.]